MFLLDFRNFPHSQFHQFLLSSHQENMVLLLYSHILHLLPKRILRFFSQSQAKPRRVTSNNIYKHDLYFQNKAHDIHGLKLLSKKVCTEIASSWPVMLYYVNTIISNTVCKQQRWLLTFQAMQERIQAFLPGQSFTLRGSPGSSINHPVMDRHPVPGSFLPPLLIELQHLILIEYWRLIYMIQIQSEQWFFSVKDFSIWHVCTETIKDQNGAQKSSPQIRGFADYFCVFAPQLSAPYKMIKWSLAKKKKKLL